MKAKHISRRKFLGVIGLGAAGFAAKKLRVGQSHLNSSTLALSDRPQSDRLVKPRAQTANMVPDVEINMRATTGAVPILPGTQTQVMRYEASLVKGDASNLVILPDNYLGPIIRVRQGQYLKVNFTNNLPEDTTVHFHGPCIPSHMGGHPHGADVVHPGKTFIYEFDVLDPASPMWFHPHPDKRTGFQVYYGLAGLYLISDALEAQAGLDTGEFDVPIVIQDRSFDANNQFAYLSGNMGMMGMMQGFLGNRILVNGKPDYVQTLSPGTYRLRIYNGSNARNYRLAWQDGSPLTVLGTDGGLLPKAVQRDYVFLAPADRVDLWVDFTGKPEGSELVMQSLPFQIGMGSMMGGGMMGSGMMAGGMMNGSMMGSGMMGGGMVGMGIMSGMAGNAAMAGISGVGLSVGQVLPQGAAFPVFKVRIAGAKKPALVLPGTLAGEPPYQLGDAVNVNNPRTIYLGMQRIQWTLNGRVFDINAVAPDEYLPFEQLEVWDFVNLTMIAHPMHIHNVQFNIIDRQSAMSGYTNYQMVHGGFVDEGWKDTVLVLPGERARILVKFLTYQGMYMYHCHILEHESMGMMRNLMVGTAPDSMIMP
jgi:FtsP/CotA-like multicopper oxidase with cupredoxin domain